jgi:ribosomal protein S18 acetylase RimI-like enzyme
MLKERFTEETDGTQWREQPLPSDVSDIEDIVLSSGFFSKEEVSIAVELIEERLLKGPESGYCFLFLEKNGIMTGYSCYGPIPGTCDSFDLYWIALRNECRGMGLGKLLLKETEKKLASLQGRHIYIETSSRNQYLPPRKFYEACGYTGEAFLKDFYSSGDSKIIYVRAI